MSSCKYAVDESVNLQLIARMEQITTLMSRCERLSEVSKLSLSTISSKLFNDGAKLKNISLGKDIGVRRLNKVMPILIALEKQYGIEVNSRLEVDLRASINHGSVDKSIEHPKEDFLGASERIINDEFLEGDIGDPDSSLCPACNHVRGEEVNEIGTALRLESVSFGSS